MLQLWRGGSKVLQRSPQWCTPVPCFGKPDFMPTNPSYWENWAEDTSLSCCHQQLQQGGRCIRRTETCSLPNSQLAFLTGHLKGGSGEQKGCGHQFPWRKKLPICSSIGTGLEIAKPHCKEGGRGGWQICYHCCPQSPSKHLNGQWGLLLSLAAHVTSGCPAWLHLCVPHGPPSSCPATEDSVSLSKHFPDTLHCNLHNEN